MKSNFFLQEFQTAPPVFLPQTRVPTDRLQDEKFDLLLRPLSNDTLIYYATNETFSLTGFLLDMKRVSYPFMMNTYLPTVLLTMASFISFLIPIDLVPGRMALLVTIFLMLVNISSTERRMGPVVSEANN